MRNKKENLDRTAVLLKQYFEFKAGSMTDPNVTLEIRLASFICMQIARLERDFEEVINELLPNENDKPENNDND